MSAAREELLIKSIGPVRSAGECVRALDSLMDLYGSPIGLLDYETSVEDDAGFTVRVHRCFAHENVTRAGIADRYDCGIFSRVEGWLDGMGCGHEIAPPLQGCLKARGEECVHRLRIQPGGRP